MTAFLVNSALLIKRDSLISLKEFLFIFLHLLNCSNIFKRKCGRKYRTIIVVRTIRIVPIEIVTIRTDFLMATVHMDGESDLLAFFA
jgi:hypothetical protein